MLGEPQVECPLDLVMRARRKPPLKTVVVNAVHPVVMTSVRDACEAGLIEPVLVGAPDAIRRAADEAAFDISRFETVAAGEEADAAQKSAEVAGSGAVEAVMKGHLHTDVLMRALLNRDAGLRVGRPFAHISYMTTPGRGSGIIISDAALNPAPDFELMQTIVQYCVGGAKAVGMSRPKVALLSASEVVNERVPSSVAAAKLAEWAQTNVQGADVAGPMALDLALSPEAARIKGIESPVAGQADILVVPEITTGNALMKMMVQLAGSCVAGLVVGAKVPIMLTSRADPPAARLASAALASIARDL